MATKKDLAAKLAVEFDLSQAKANEAVNFLFNTIAEELQNGEEVDVYGFGKFSVKEKPERQGINPATKEQITIPAKNAVSFKPSKGLKDKVN